MANETQKRRSRVFLVGDHPLVREHLAALLQGEADLEVCGEAAGGPGALPLIARRAPALVVLDVSLPASPGLELLKSLKQSWPNLPVLVLSLHDERRYVEWALRAGAMGYITTEEAAINILPAIRRVLDGQVYLSDRMAGQVGEKWVSARSGIAAQVSA
jgi:DNA-binding NarL/FixJ family response regulator